MVDAFNPPPSRSPRHEQACRQCRQYRFRTTRLPWLLIDTTVELHEHPIRRFFDHFVAVFWWR